MRRDHLLTKATGTGRLQMCTMSQVAFEIDDAGTEREGVPVLVEGWLPGVPCISGRASDCRLAASPAGSTLGHFPLMDKQFCRQPARRGGHEGLTNFCYGCCRLRGAARCSVLQASLNS